MKESVSWDRPSVVRRIAGAKAGSMSESESEDGQWSSAARSIVAETWMVRPKVCYSSA